MLLLDCLAHHAALLLHHAHALASHGGGALGPHHAPAFHHLLALHLEPL